MYFLCAHVCMHMPVQVNGVQLYGKSRREAVAFLREVPPPFTLVCCRLLSEEEPEVQDWRPDSPVTGSPEQVLHKYTHFKANNNRMPAEWREFGKWILNHK